MPKTDMLVTDREGYALLEPRECPVCGTLITQVCNWADEFDCCNACMYDSWWKPQAKEEE